MSIVMPGDVEKGASLGNAPAWRAGTIFAIALHAGLAAAIVYSQFGTEQEIEPLSSAVTLDLAPIASAPPQPVTNLPEGPPVEEPEPEEEPAPTTEQLLAEILEELKKSSEARSSEAH